MMKFLLGSAAFLFMVVGTRAENQADKGNPLLVDDQFLIQALEGHNNSTRILDLVDSRSQNAKVREFAKTVLDEHKKLGMKLATAAKERKLTIVALPNKQAQEEYDRLSKEKGPEFDKDFLATFIRGHDKALALCEHQISAGKEQPLTTCAKECTTALKDHLKRAKDLQTEINK
jgi:putative membrane protein